MRARVSGSGPKIILLHGWSASGRVMETLASGLDDQYETHVLDLPGHGDAVEGRVDLQLKDMIDATSAYMRRLAEPVSVIGWAMGAMIALKLAATLNVRSAICIGTPSGGPEHGPAFVKLAARVGKDWPRYVKTSVDAIVGDRVSPEMHAFLVSVMQKTSPTLARRTLMEVAAIDSSEWASDVQCPVLYAHGAQDVISPVVICDKLLAATRNCELKIYDGIGHAPFLETRETLLNDVKTFLGKYHA